MKYIHITSRESMVRVEEDYKKKSVGQMSQLIERCLESCPSN